ncbi:HDOD domain-containing protein [Sulfurimonas sp. SAG-AH-194-I05]|nr:HDOD domain-containing protein [Sulfurimonas sp. SAG-AH-194-I05]MDF1874642.1 HDOD domain-containing protein [Sulfurimonas sp. SAG-AH-194-I05]
MITKNKINDFIEKIPPAPKALQATIILLNKGELTKAGQIAQTDLALCSYLKNIVNKPIYGFRNEVTDIVQIFGILGLSTAQQTVYNYMMTLLSPDKWELFKLQASTFQDLQARLSIKWKMILAHLNIKDNTIESAITLLPASIIVSEALFCEKKDDVDLLRTVHDIDLNTVLSRLCGLDLFDICQKIAEKWNMPDSIATIIHAASGLKPIEEQELNTLGKWMHLLLFYELSQTLYVEAGLNDFIEFQLDYVSDIYDDFIRVMEIL